MRPGVRRQKFVVTAKALFQIGGQPVINRTAVGVVGIHVAERDAAGESAGRRITSRAESALLQDRQRRVDAALCGRANQSAGNRGIQASGTEEVGQRRRDPGHAVDESAGSRASADRERSRGRIGSGIVQRHLPVSHQQIAARGVGVDGAVQMAAAIEVVAQAERHVVSQVLLESQVRLLRVGVNEILCLADSRRAGRRPGRNVAGFR